LAIYGRLGDERGQAAALHQLGFTALRWNESREALEHFQRARELRRRIGDRRGEARNLVGIAACYEKMAQRQPSGWPDPSLPVYGNLPMTERALRVLREAVEILRETGDRSAIWRVLFNLGAIHENRGEDERALPYYREALEVSTAANERRAAEYQLACGTDLGRTLSDELRNDDLRCPMAAFGSTALLFDEEEEWD
jgi:tetratricopeptide (TPR) repeat protein